ARDGSPGDERTPGGARRRQLLATAARRYPEQLAEFEERMWKMLVPDDTITTWVDIGDVLETKWAAIQKHVTQINMDFPFMKLGFDGWREFWGRETFVLRESMVEQEKPESDVFAGLD